MARNRAFGKIQEDQDKTGFCKVLADEDLSSEAMRLIPREFKTSVCENVPLKVILKVAWGRSWTVSLSKSKGHYLMEKKGWEKFLKDNHLGDKEFLTFTNEGNNCLSVDIFEKNCRLLLEPRKNTIIASSKDVKIEETSIDEPVIAESSRRGAKSKKEIAAEEEEQNKSKKLKKNVSRASSSSASSSVAAFSLTITQSYLKILGIPQEFAKKHMPKEKTEFVIHDPKGKQWEVVFVHGSNGQKVFSKGWRILVRDYGLAVGDHCTFKLTKPHEMVLEVLHASE